MYAFNPKIYELATQAGATDEKGGSISSGVISFTKYEFEDFMTRYTRYVQARMQAIVKKANDEFTYMGDDVPSGLLIQELEEALIGKE